MSTKLFTLPILLCSIANAANTQPKVVFIGDYITSNWTNAFATHPNWVNKGVNGVDLDGQKSGDVAARFQTDVVDLHPAVVHILVGSIDAAVASGAVTPSVSSNFETNLDSMVKAAKAAHIKVILATTPSSGDGSNIELPQINSIVTAYGAANNIPVINYADLLCQCVVSLGQQIDAPNGYQQPANNIPGPYPSSTGYTTALLPTTAGYALMTQVAETVVANELLTMETGWLSNVAMEEPYLGLNPGGLTNLNSVPSGATLQFTPVGYYSDGSTHPQTNTNSEGASGTWTSSDPLVMSISQQGLALANTPGTATIKFVPRNGVDFHPWVMHVYSFY